MSVMGIRCRLRRIGDPFERHQTSASEPAAGRKQIGEFMRRGVLQFQNAVLRHLAVPALALLIGIGSALAQSGDSRAQDQSGKPAANAAPRPMRPRTISARPTNSSKRRRPINGPAGNPECVWLGRRVVSLMWRDDLDTAFRHLDLYDRFGCPGGHVQATFRCLTRFGGQIDPKVPETLSSRVHACWINPAAQPQAAAAASRRRRPTTAARPAGPAAAAPAAARAAPGAAGQIIQTAGTIRNFPGLS